MSCSLAVQCRFVASWPVCRHLIYALQFCLPLVRALLPPVSMLPVAAPVRKYIYGKPMTNDTASECPLSPTIFNSNHE